MYDVRTTRGFTMIEIVVVVALIALIAGFSAIGLRQLFESALLTTASGEVYDALVSARSRTLASENDTVFGVRISTSSVTRFEGGTYTEGTASNKVYAFPTSVTATGTLAVNNSSIVFERLTGEPSATGTIILLGDEGSSTTTIGIYASGLIQYDE